MNAVTRVTDHPAKIIRGVLVTFPPHGWVRVHFQEATLSYDSGPRLVRDEREARTCIDRWISEYHEKYPRGAAIPPAGEGSFSED